MKTKPTIENVPIGKLKAYDSNARTHSPEQVAQIAASMVEFGFTNPVLIDKRGTIVAGHGRVEAARSLGLEEVPCIRLEHLTEDQVRAYCLADNKLALNAGWDDAMLKAELDILKEEGFNMDLTGFTDAEVEKILGQFDAEAGEMPELSDEDRQPFQQKTFVLHDEQAEEVEAAIAKAKEMGHGQSVVNENSNGNALAFVCQFFNREQNK
jgi:ParB family chromosome partitioning protein